MANIDSTNVWSWLDNFIEKAEKQNREGEVEEKRYSKNSTDDKKITLGMSDAERVEILKSTSIEPQEIEILSGFDIDVEALQKNQKSKIEKTLINKLRELGCLRKYSTSNVDVEFSFTGNSLRKSIHSQVNDYGGNLEDLSKVVMNMQKLLDRSVLIEIHSDKAKGTDRENPQLVQTYVLLSSFYENNSITPVQFEIKKYVDNENRLYLAVALTKIETSVKGDTALQKEGRTRLLPVSNISISQLIEKINTAFQIEEAPTNYGVVRPVGNALQNASSDNSITESGAKVNKKTELPQRNLLQVKPLLILCVLLGLIIV